MKIFIARDLRKRQMLNVTQSLWLGNKRMASILYCCKENCYNYYIKVSAYDRVMQII